jgi:threonylcarbamoyladenosine tRNA methylthiotransferase MtaB
MALRVAFFTLGCKLNQLETESFADAFARAGSEICALDAEESSAAGAAPQGAAPPGAAPAAAAPLDLFVINTCTVTGKADRKARRMVRLALAENPRAAALITGCYAQVDAQALASLDERALVLPGQSKELLLGLPEWLSQRPLSEDLPALLREWLASALGSAMPPGDRARFAFKPEAFSFHSRPSLKVQDGCDNACAYCLVRVARGPSVSLAAAELLARARALEERGREELVLTGVNLSQYRDGDIDFPALLRFLVEGTDRIAFRLSSYEPERIDEAFLEAFSHPRVRPHVHLAAQSGSARVLEVMGRRYGPRALLAAVESLRRAKGDPFIAADFISGFPGETEADAEATLELARTCDFAWIHSFRFSPRPGTRAAAMAGRVPEAVAGRRAEALAELGKAGKLAYINRCIGSQATAVLEIGLGGTSANYLRLKMRGLPPEARPGQAVVCRIEEGPRAAWGERVDGCALYIKAG